MAESAGALGAGELLLCSPVRSAYRLAGGRQPLFPLLWALGRTVGVQQEPLTDWTAPVLNQQQVEAGPVHRQAWSLVSPPIDPLLDEGGVVG